MKLERDTSGQKDRRSLYDFSIGLQASLVGYMVSSFFASVAYLWYVYYLVAYSIALLANLRCVDLTNRPAPLCGFNLRPALC